MNPSPILMEIAGPLPDNAPSRQQVEQAASYEAIAKQAGFEWNCLARPDQELEPGKNGDTWLHENGYADFLKDADKDDRTRMLGYLRMLSDMAEDLAEEEAEEEED